MIKCVSMIEGILGISQRRTESMRFMEPESFEVFQ